MAACAVASAVSASSPRSRAARNARSRTAGSSQNAQGLRPACAGHPTGGVARAQRRFVDRRVVVAGGRCGAVPGSGPPDHRNRGSCSGPAGREAGRPCPHRSVAMARVWTTRAGDAAPTPPAGPHPEAGRPLPTVPVPPESTGPLSLLQLDQLAKRGNEYRPMAPGPPVRRDRRHEVSHAEPPYSSVRITSPPGSAARRVIARAGARAARMRSCAWGRCSPTVCQISPSIARSEAYFSIRAAVTCGMSPSAPRPAARTAARNRSAGTEAPGRGSAGSA